MRTHYSSVSAVVRYCPVPDRYTVCGLLLASSLSTIFAVLVPTSLGVNITVIEQLAPPASAFGLIGQLFVWVKLAAFVPITATLEMVWAALSLLVRTVVIDPLTVP